MGVEGRLDPLQAGVELAEEGGGVLRAHALAVLAPQQAAVLPGQRSHLVGDLADQPLLLRVLHVDGRAHVEHPGIHVAKHAVGEPARVEGGAELTDEVRQVLRRHRGVLDEGDRALLALVIDPGVAEQAHGALAHGVDPLDLRPALGQGEAQAIDARVRLQVSAEGLDPLGQPLGVVVVELDEVDAAHRRVACREELGHAVPDEVLHGQQQHGVVYRLDGRRPRITRHQRLGIAQGVHEARVAHVDQGRVPGDRQHVEHRLVEQAERALRAAQQAVEVEVAVLGAQVRQVVAGQAAVERREGGLDQLALGVDDLPGGAVGRAGDVVARAERRERIVGQRAADQALAAEQHGLELEHVVAGLAVLAAALAAGVGGDHAADGGAVGGGEVRREEEPVGLERGVELVLDHPGLDAHPAVLDVDVEDGVHVPRDVDHQAVGERLAVGAGAAPARREHHLAMRLASGQAGDALEVLAVARAQHGLGQALVDGVVGGEHRAGGEVRGDLALEALGFQRLEKAQVAGVEARQGAGVSGVQACDHGVVFSGGAALAGQGRGKGWSYSTARGRARASRGPAPRGAPAPFCLQWAP